MGLPLTDSFFSLVSFSNRLGRRASSIFRRVSCFARPMDVESIASIGRLRASVGISVVVGSGCVSALLPMSKSNKVTSKKVESIMLNNAISVS